MKIKPSWGMKEDYIMTYDFTSILERSGRDAIAVDGLGHPGCPGAPGQGWDAIPMWVADMNFPTLPDIQEAVISRAQHPAFGYFGTSDDYFSAIIDWQEKRNGVKGLTKEAIGYENGVLGGVISALNAVCARGDKVLLHSPTYIGFTGALSSNGYRIVHSPLRRDENGVWRMDYADMEQKIVENDIHAAVFCSPHNPCGRVWEREEIEQAMAVYEKHQVYVISDEIWSDIILPGHTHIPTQSVSDYAKSHTAAFYAPSKTFNLAGLIGSYHVIYDPWLRSRVLRESAISCYNSMNVLSMHAAIAAFSPHGMQWVDELTQVIAGNVRIMSARLRENAPEIEFSEPEGTYMMFLDCSRWCADHGKTLDQLLASAWEVGVAIQDGRPFGGECTVRMNLASPAGRIREAADRLAKYVLI